MRRRLSRGAWQRLLVAALLGTLFLVPAGAGQAPDCPCTVFTPDQAPAGDAQAGEPLEVGMRFRSSEDGFISAVRFYKQPGDTGRHVGHLWNDAGERLAEVVFTGETASGWQQADLETPVAIVKDTTYIASYHSGEGRYAYNRSSFSSPAAGAPLRALADGADGPNGVFRQGDSGYPTSSRDDGANYWVDAVFDRTVRAPEPGSGPDPDRPPAADVFVSGAGSDAAACTAAEPCKSLARAYALAPAGGVVSVGRGTYGEQEIPNGTKALTFSGESGARLRRLDNYAANVTFDGVDIDADFREQTAFESHGAANVTFRNGRIGNVTDEKGALVSGANFTFDNVTFHDVRVTDPQVHNECVYAIGVPGMTVSNSLFRDCATMDLFFTYGDWWRPRPPAYGDVTVENNVFARTTTEVPGETNYYSLYIGDLGPDDAPVSGWTVRHNTFETPVAVRARKGGNSRWVGNLGAWDCVSGVAYRRNVGERCDDTDTPLVADAAGREAAFGWVDAARYDFRLRAGSPAIDAGDPNDHPAADRQGHPRGELPDAGAYEHRGD